MTDLPSLSRILRTTQPRTCALEKYRDEMIDPDTDEERAAHFDKKLEKNLKRKAAAASRANAWDNFQQRQAEEDADVKAPPEST